MSIWIDWKALVLSGKEALRAAMDACWLLDVEVLAVMAGGEFCEIWYCCWIRWFVWWTGRG